MRWSSSVFEQVGTRAGIIGLAVLLLLSLAGCSTMRLAYGQANHLAYWWLDGYIGFTDEQAPRVKEGLAQWLAWHRESQLEDYAGLLATMRRQSMADVTPAQVCRLGEEMRARLDPALQQALPLVAELVPGLSAGQIAQLRKRYAKGNADLRKDFLQADPEKRLKASTERAVERFENFYGPLDDDQRALVAARVKSSPFDADTWVRDRIARQQDILRTLQRLAAERAEPAQALPVLRALAQRIQQPPAAESQAYQQRLIAYNCEFTAALHNTTSAAQRRQAQEKLHGWEQDLRVLAGNAPRRTASAMR